MSTNNFYFALLHSLGLSHKKLREISPDQVEQFYENVDIKKLLSIGYNIESAQKIVDKKKIQNVDNVEHQLRSLAIRVLHFHEIDYPELLRNISDAPTMLYVRGVLRPEVPLFSIVGSRQHSSYAKLCLDTLIPDLVRAGFGIVSGGAYGIDSLAHSVTLASNGYTMAIFGSGIDVSYPVSNTRLFDTVIEKGGALMSHFPLGTLAEPFNFPIRNTLVAGISRGTLIAEAGEDSGTLITARLAVEYNRDVFVLPADVTREGARGSNALIRDGLGKLITGSADILGEYTMSNVDTVKNIVFSHPDHQKVYERIVSGPQTIDELVEQTLLDPGNVMHILALLEIEGHIRAEGSLYYA